MTRLCFLVSIELAACAITAAAQGTLNFANFGGGNNYPIMLVNGAASPSDGVLVDLYYGSSADGIRDHLGLQVQIQGNGLFTATAPGNENPAVIPGFAPGDPLYVRVVAWQGGSSYKTATLRKNATQVFLISRLGGGTIPPANIPMGSGSLELAGLDIPWEPPPIPEPTALSLLLLGLTGLLLVRRQRGSCDTCS